MVKSENITKRALTYKNTKHINAFIGIKHITNYTHYIVLQCLSNKLVPVWENKSAALLGFPLHIHCTTYPEHLGQKKIKNTNSADKKFPE